MDQLESGGRADQVEEPSKTCISEADLLKMQFDFAWKWFELHAKQRMQLFNFFLIITGILANAYVNSYERELHLMSLTVCFLGTLQTMGFFIFDVRSRDLTRHAEDVLEKIEIDHLYPEGFSHEAVRNGIQLGLLRREAATSMREGNDYRRKRGFRNLFKIKFWIFLIQIVVGTSFLIGFFFAFCSELHRVR